MSPFLHIYPCESDFDNLQEYCEREYIDKYYEGIKRILFRIICYYDSIVYLTKLYEGNPLKKFKKYEYQNFRDKGLDEISTALELVIIKGKTHIPSKDSVITIGSGFDTTIYSEDETILEEIKSYVESEGLFFIKRD